MGSKNVIGELLGGNVGSQADLARNADLAKSTVSRAVNGGGMGWVAALKAARPLGVNGPALYAAVNLKATVEDESAGPAEKLERIGRIVLTLGKSDADEDDPGMDEVLTAIEDAIENLGGAAVDSVRSEKPEARTATKAAPMYGAFKAQFDTAGTAVPRAEDYDVQDGRDLHGRKLKLTPDEYGEKRDSRSLRDDEEHSFPPVDDFDTGNILGDDDEALEGRDAFGQRRRPLDRR